MHLLLGLLIFVTVAYLGWWLGSQPWIKRGNCTVCGSKLSPYTHEDWRTGEMARFCHSCPLHKELCGPDEEPNPLF